MDESNILWLLKQLDISLDHYGREKIENGELTQSQFFMLNYLIAQEEHQYHATDIHLNIGISKAAISSNLKSLKQKGYLRLVAAPGDDRKKQIVLSQKAYSAAGMMKASLKKHQTCLCHGISQQNLKILEDSLNIMIANIKRETTRGKIYDKNALPAD